MSEPLTIAGSVGGGADVRSAIARAAQRTGVDFDYLLAQAKIESSLNPEARAATSSAAGLYQFTRGTWLQTLERHGADHGLGWAQAAIRGGQVADPAMRSQIMALRHDPAVASLMAAELAGDNRTALAGQLGREPDAAELYLAHFLGIGGAGQVLTALQSDPGQSAAALLPTAAAANRSIFYDGAGAPRSVAGLMEVIRGKVGRAMEGDTAWAEVGQIAASGPAGFMPQPGWAGGAAPAAAAPPPRPSMAETLRNTFALGEGSGASAPAFVREAYGRLRSMGL